MKALLNKISSVVVSNLIGLAVSTIVVLIIPKFIDVSQYGYFQLYIFYVGYIGFLNFGWPEGIMLRYGGKKYADLDRASLKTQIISFTILSSFIGFIILLISLIKYNNEACFVFIGIAICIIVYLPRAFMQVILHMTNRIKEYSNAIIIERIGYLICVIVLLMLRVKNYPMYILSDIVGRFFALIYIGYNCRDILKSDGNSIKNEIKEIRLNIKIGIKLMFANLAGLFIIGIVRQCIKMKWNIEEFAKVSLTLSISNMLITVIRSISIVLFPFLKRVDENKLPYLYEYIRTVLITFLFSILLFYYPVKELLLIWLPKYSESFYYMAILLPMCIYECKNCLLIETYMKTLRMEKKLLIINVMSVILSFILSTINTYIFENLNLNILTILVLVAFRCICSEIALTKKLNIKMYKDIILELVVVISFIISNWFINDIYGVLVYSLCVVVYIFINKNNIKKAYKKIKLLLIEKKEVNI